MKNLKFNKISKPKQKLDMISRIVNTCENRTYVMYIDGERFYEYKSANIVISLILNNTITGWVPKDDSFVMEYAGGEFNQYIHIEKQEG